MPIVGKAQWPIAWKQVKTTVYKGIKVVLEDSCANSESMV